MARRDKLPAILAAHALWLDTDGREGARADLHTANLEGAKLAGARLQKANLRHAKLGGADFSKADLRGADLRGAKLVVTVQGYNELDLPREYATADFTGAQLGGVLADVPLDGSTPLEAPADAPPEMDGPATSPDDASASWVIPWPVSLDQLEALARRAGGVLDPQLTQVGALLKSTDDASEAGGVMRVWQRTNHSCSLGVMYTQGAATRTLGRGLFAEAWWVSAATRFGTVVLNLSQRGSDAHVPLIIEVTGTPEQEAAVLAELRAALGRP